MLSPWEIVAAVIIDRLAPSRLNLRSQPGTDFSSRHNPCQGLCPRPALLEYIRVVDVLGLNGSKSAVTNCLAMHESMVRSSPRGVRHELEVEAGRRSGGHLVEILAWKCCVWASELIQSAASASSTVESSWPGPGMLPDSIWFRRLKSSWLLRHPIS